MMRKTRLDPTRPELGSWALGWSVIERIADLLEPKKTILELGSGQGTTILRKYWKVWSVEHNPHWIAQLPCLKDCYVISAPLVDDWYDLEILKAQLPAHYDLLLIDGPPGALSRSKIADHIDLFDTTVPMILDDVQRPEVIKAAFDIGRANKKRVSILPASHGRQFALID